MGKSPCAHAGCPFANGCHQSKDCFVADMGHICCRDSVVGSRSRGQAQRREGRPRLAVSDEEREKETRQAQNRTEQANRVLLDA